VLSDVEPHPAIEATIAIVNKIDTTFFFIEIPPSFFLDKAIISVIFDIFYVQVFTLVT
jgi:hypothetical protein